MRPVQSQLQLQDINVTKMNATIDIVADRQCRICLSSTCESNNRFITPCQCTGSMKYVHQNCLKQWLQVKVIRDIDNDAGNDLSDAVQCQLCHTNIEVEKIVNRRCNSVAQIKKRVKNSQVSFGICLIGLLISLSLLIYSFVQVSAEIRRGYDRFPVLQRVVVICSILLNFLLIVFFTYHLLPIFTQKQAKICLKDRVSS